MGNILVIYYTRQSPMRASQRDHLLSFKRHASNHNCFYLNLFIWNFPSFIQEIKFDMIVFSWSFLGHRFSRNDYIGYLNKLSSIKNMSGIKIALPQDEFSNTDLICRTITQLNITKVYSVSPESEWKKLYSTINFDKVKVSQVLTGYIEKSVINKIKKLEHHINRDIDIGYRSGATSIWGRFNLIKFYIAEKIQFAAVNYNLKLDIDFGWQNFFIGDNWYKFLLRCKYIPGVEGGSSILDWDGSLSNSIQKFLLTNPDADFDSIEKACIAPGRDGEINVVALSPRHLEACITRTCQILIKGNYNGILLPGIHYIELNSDFSNLNAVLDIVKSDHLRNTIVERAYQDIVHSGKYSYESFIRYIIKDTKITSQTGTRWKFLLWQIVDDFSWVLVYLFSLGRSIRNTILLPFSK